MTCDNCPKEIDMNVPKGHPMHSNSVCVDCTPGFKEYDHYCDECYAIPAIRDQEPHFDRYLAGEVMYV